MLTRLRRRLSAGLVHVHYRQQLGNRLFQHCLGRIIASELGFALEAGPISGFPSTEIRLARPWWAVYPGQVQVVGFGHRVDLDAVLADRRARIVVLDGFFLRYEYFRCHKERIRRDWLPSPAGERGHPDDLVIHIRTGPDVWQSSTSTVSIHPEYHALPFSFYKGVIQDGRWRRVQVVTRDPQDPMVRRLVSTFGASIVSGLPIEDFNTIRSARNIVLSVSTFAWWAAWLSGAERIYYPIAGLFDPERGRNRASDWQHDLLVDDEPRYRQVYPRTVSGDWKGTETDRQRLLYA